MSLGEFTQKTHIYAASIPLSGCRDECFFKDFCRFLHLHLAGVLVANDSSEYVFINYLEPPVIYYLSFFISYYFPPTLLLPLPPGGRVGLE